MTWANRALACRPQWDEALFLLATAWIGAGSGKRGGKFLRRTAALSPANPLLWRVLGSIEWQAGAAQSALACQRRSFILHGPGSHQEVQLAILEMLVGSPERAARLTSLAAQSDRSTMEALTNAGFVALSKSRALAAEMVFERLLDASPADPKLALGLQHARLTVGQSPDEVARIHRSWGSAGTAAFHPRDERRRGASPGYLVSKGYGCGFWGEVLNTAIDLALADISGREPVVMWGSEVRYRHPEHENAWDLYFEPITAHAIRDLVRPQRSVFPAFWAPEALTSSDNLRAFQQQVGNRNGISALIAINRPEEIVVSDGYVDMKDVLPWVPAAHRWTKASALEVFRDVFATKIRPKREIEVQLDKWAESLGCEGHIAVHYRAQSDGKNHEALEKSGIAVADYFAPLDRLLIEDPAAKIFLITDLDEAVDLFKSRYQDRIVTLDRIRLLHSESTLPGSMDLGFNAALDGYRLGLEVLIDAYLAARCRKFVGDGASGVSAAIVALKHWPDDAVTLVRRNVFTERGGRLIGGIV